MYEELIKRLRDYSTARKGEIAELTEEAANAIEEMSAAVAGYEASTDVEFVKENGHERIRFVPKWIPVNKRLPEKAGAYLVCETWDNRSGSMYNIRVVSYSLNLNNVDKYAFHGKEYKRPGWFDSDSEYGHFETGRDITHWMPLPTPPKEETE